MIYRRYKMNNTVYLSKDEKVDPEWVEKLVSLSPCILPSVFFLHNGGLDGECIEDDGKYHVVVKCMGSDPVHYESITYIGCRWDLGPAFELAANSIGLYLWGRHDPKNKNP